MCTACSIARSLDQRTQLCLELLEQQRVRDLYLKFVDWARNTMEPLRLTTRLFHYASFFRSLDRGVSSAAEVDDDTISGIYTTEELRRYGVPYSFLVSQGLSLSSSIVRADRSEVRRVEQMHTEAEAIGFREVVERYCAWLQCPDRKSRQLRAATIRTYVRAALELLKTAENYPPSQHALDQLLRSKPGHRASLASLLRFIELDAGSKLVLRSQPETGVALTSSALASQVAELIHRMDNQGAQISERRAALACALSIALGLPLSHVLLLQVNEVDVTRRPVSLVLAGETLALPDELGSRVEAMAPPDSKDYFFAGRIVGDSLSTSAVYFYRKRWATERAAR